MLGVQLQSLEVRAPHDLEGAFEAAIMEHADGILIVGSDLTFSQRARIIDLAAQHRLPAIYPNRAHTAAGGLMAYGPSSLQAFRRAAVFVDKILQGTKPADLPVEQPRLFDFIVNLKTAQALGITIPPLLLFQADEVIR
jgi:putative ABC transport system substrate-binding protein